MTGISYKLGGPGERLSQKHAVCWPFYYSKSSHKLEPCLLLCFAYVLNTAEIRSLFQLYEDKFCIPVLELKEINHQVFTCIGMCTFLVEVWLLDLVSRSDQKESLGVNIYSCLLGPQCLFNPYSICFLNCSGPKRAWDAQFCSPSWCD